MKKFVVRLLVLSLLALTFASMASAQQDDPPPAGVVVEVDSHANWRIFNGAPYAIRVRFGNRGWSNDIPAGRYAYGRTDQATANDICAGSPYSLPVQWNALEDGVQHGSHVGITARCGANDNVSRAATNGSASNSGSGQPAVNPGWGSATPQGCAVTSSGNSSNIRAEASTSANRVGRVYSGYFVSVIGVQTVGLYTWVQVSGGPNGTTGWLRGDVVLVTGDCSAFGI